MSFFRPHKSKPRQFNYIPRHFDPVKEERDLRRKELHGTSSEDDYENYVPGKYIRTQRDARDAVRENEASAGSKKMRNMIFMGVIVTIFVLFITPQIVSFVDMAQKEKERIKKEQEAYEQEQRRRMIIMEEYSNIEGIDDPRVLMENMTDMEEWQKTIRSITIVPDDAEIEE